MCPPIENIMEIFHKEIMYNTLNNNIMQLIRIKHF